jgi:hypothetical protein
VEAMGTDGYSSLGKLIDADLHSGCANCTESGEIRHENLDNGIFCYPPARMCVCGCTARPKTIATLQTKCTSVYTHTAKILGDSNYLARLTSQIDSQ